MPGWRQALRLLHYDYASALAQLRKTASEHAERSGIAFPIGTCFLHRARGCAPACQRCRCCLPGLPVGWIPTREAVFYDDASNLAQLKEIASELVVIVAFTTGTSSCTQRGGAPLPAKGVNGSRHPLSRGGHPRRRVLRALNAAHAMLRHTMTKGGVGSGQCQNALSTYCVLNAAPARSGLHCKCAVHLLYACACACSNGSVRKRVLLQSQCMLPWQGHAHSTRGRVWSTVLVTARRVQRRVGGQQARVC